MRASGLLLLLWLGGCAGALESPERFESQCSFDVQEDLLHGTCGGTCHGGESPSAGLDLSAPGVGARLLAAKNGCDEGPMIAAGGGYLLAKVGAAPPCGDAMPLRGMALTEEETRCLVQYVDHLVAQGGAR